MQYHVMVDLIRREASIYRPDGLIVAALSRYVDELPITLAEETEATSRKKRQRRQVAEVMMMQQGEDEIVTDDDMSCDSAEPCVHLIPLYPGAFEYSRPVEQDSYH